jgi:glycosyltransferase involved in cell wall biosynthesis
LSSQDLRDAYAAATIVCQPSLVESFSLVLMEAWLAQTPVLVHGDCPVTVDHVRQSRGGLYYRSATEFRAVLDWLLERREVCEHMGASGRAYVLSHYGWPAVLRRFQACLHRWS